MTDIYVTVVGDISQAENILEQTQTAAQQAEDALVKVEEKAAEIEALPAQVEIQSSGTILGTQAKALNFSGSGVFVTKGIEDDYTISITGGGGAGGDTPEDVRDKLQSLQAGQRLNAQYIDQTTDLQFVSQAEQQKIADAVTTDSTSPAVDSVALWDADRKLKAGASIGTAADQIVQLDDQARLPAVDGSQLTGIELNLVDRGGFGNGDGPATMLLGGKYYVTGYDADQEMPGASTVGLLTVLSDYSGNSGKLLKFETASNVYARVYSGGAWGDWINVNSAFETPVHIRDALETLTGDDRLPSSAVLESTDRLFVTSQQSNRIAGSVQNDASVKEAGDIPVWNADGTLSSSSVKFGSSSGDVVQLDANGNIPSEVKSSIKVETLGDAFRDLNNPDYSTLDSGFYIVSGTGAELSNYPAEVTIQQASNYVLEIQINNSPNQFLQRVVFTSDSDWDDQGREAVRMGSTQAAAITTGWKVFAFRSDTSKPEEGFKLNTGSSIQYDDPTGTPTSVFTAGDINPDGHPQSLLVGSRQHGLTLRTFGDGVYVSQDGKTERVTLDGESSQLIDRGILYDLNEQFTTLQEGKYYLDGWQDSSGLPQLDNADRVALLTVFGGYDDQANGAYWHLTSHRWGMYVNIKSAGVETGWKKVLFQEDLFQEDLSQDPGQLETYLGTYGLGVGVPDAIQVSGGNTYQQETKAALFTLTGTDINDVFIQLNSSLIESETIVTVPYDSYVTTKRFTVYQDNVGDSTSKDVRSGETWRVRMFVDQAGVLHWFWEKTQTTGDNVVYGLGGRNDNITESSVKLFAYREAMPKHLLIETPNSSRLVHEFPKNKTFRFTPISSGRQHDGGVLLTEANQGVATNDLALGQYSDMPLYIIEPNVVVNRDQRAFISFPASVGIDISNGFYVFGTVSGWCGNNSTEGGAAVYVGTSDNFRSYTQNIGFVLGNTGVFILDGQNVRTPDNSASLGFNVEAGVTHMYRYAFYVDATGLMNYYIVDLNTGQVSQGEQQCNIPSIGPDPKLYISYDRYANNTAAIAIAETHFVINSVGVAEDRWNWRN